MTNPKAYTAPHAVYVEGKLYKPGEVFVTDDTPGKDWERVTTAEKAAIEASEPLAGDPPLESLSKAALEAIAIERRVDPTGLNKQQLLAAIKAADEPRL